MRTVPFSLYDAFSEKPFGGSQAGIVLDAEAIDAATRLQIARELGLPAVCFVTGWSDNSVTARFQSTEREYPMCGHGTICLMTHLIALGALNWGESDHLEVDLVLPTTRAKVEIHRRADGRAEVMLDIEPPEFRQDDLNLNELANLLELSVDDFARDLPVETAVGDFVHLIVPVKDLASMRAITPNFSAITQFCGAHGIETMACFSREVEQPDHEIHVRDFCPAVGVPESAAAGTTNAALTSYLIRHGLVQENLQGQIDFMAEQGHEINRPSALRSIVRMKNSKIARLQIGGVATKVLDGNLHLPEDGG